MTHYYTKTAETAYTVIGANGKEKGTTIKDARKLGLLPSVTTITNILDKAGLMRYFLQQAVGVIFSEERQKEGESFEDYADRILVAARRESNEAAKRGSYLHNCLEKYFQGEGLKEKEFTRPILKEIDLLFPLTTDFGDIPGNFHPEKKFASYLGYGGKVDLVCDDGNNGIVIDFKSKNTTDKKKFYKYEEHLMQLSAYRQGLELPNARCFDIYFSSVEPGIVEVHEWSNEELKRGFKQFQCLLDYWKLVNNYDPTIPTISY